MYLSLGTILELVDLGDKIMKNKRRNHSAQFKVNVALAAAKGQKTMQVEQPTYSSNLKVQAYIV